MNVAELEGTARALVAEKKGILAADESHGTIARRFKSINTAATEETRRAWRELLFTTEGIGEFISGVILFDETARQSASTGRRLVEILRDQGVIPGIKVDKGAKALAGAPDETVTEGLDGLRERLEEYYELGARFSKWRAVITIGEGIPTANCIDTNAHALARYAALSQAAGLVPIVEPEVLMDGDHDIQRCLQVTAATQQRVFQALFDQGVVLEGALLKPNMVLSGKNAANRGRCGGGGGGDDRLLPPDGPGGDPGHRLPVGRTERRGGDAQLECHQQAGRTVSSGDSLAAQLFLRARPPSDAVEGMGRRCGERGAGASGVRPSRPGHQRRATRDLQSGDGEGAGTRVGGAGCGTRARKAGARGRAGDVGQARWAGCVGTNRSRLCRSRWRRPQRLTAP